MADMPLPIVAAVLAGLLGYIAIGAYYLYNDYDVVHSCKASNEQVHIIWPTSLWTYVLFSLCFAGAFAVMLLMMPIRQSFQKMKPEKPKYVRGGSGQKLAPQAPKFGILPNLPDWLFLVVGSAMMFQSIAICMLAFWGYAELFLARPWCEDKKTAFEELDLWYFGQVTLFLQIGVGILTFCWAMLYWAIPFCFELNTSFSEKEPLLSDVENGRRSRPDRS